MMAFPDDTMLNGTWGIILTDPEHPFVIGDTPMVTRERTANCKLYFGQGFARPNVEVFLPVSLTCMYPRSALCRAYSAGPPTSSDRRQQGPSRVCDEELFHQ